MPEPLDRLTAALADRYRIERELGAGGMATVYLAHDLKHDRDVAIKVLHPDLGAALGGDRFLSEIKTTARLQHPHILPLLDSDEAEGLLYYVMPHVSGETLRARLERERQLPIEDALRIAREVADALGAAHAIGIIHRDIKPENILLQGGHALVADFGIALAVQSAGGQRMTQTGLSLGTPQYMSPEQAMGEKTIDARSDIYALGAVTYEMMLGEPPFTGPTVQTIVAKVLTERPTAPRAVRDTVPPGVEQAILTALAKLPADRFATAERFADALADGRTGGRADGPSIPVRTTFRIRPALAGGGAALLLLAALAGWWMGKRSKAPEATWSEFTQLTDAAGVETGPSLSPDGESFAFASNARGSFDIFVQRVGGRNPVVVAGDSTVDEVWPAYSPDGTQIVYSLGGGGGVFVVGATGESARRLTTFGANPAWSPDGRRIVFGSEEVITAYNVNLTGKLWVVDVSGGEPHRLEAGATNLYQPSWSPSGRRIAFWSAWAGQRDLETMLADGSARVKLTDDAALDWAPTWSPDGRYLYFASDRGGTMGLWRIGVDEASGKATSTPEPVASGVDVAMDLPRLSGDGTMLILRSKLESVNPAAIAFDPATGKAGAVTMLQHRTGILAPADVSPDGKWLALGNVPDRHQDLWLMRPDGSGLRRLTDDEARDWNPRFTPDGQALTFFSNQNGRYDGWMIKLDGSGRTRLTDIAPGVTFTAFSPDGTRLLAARVGPGGVIGGPPWPMTDSTAKPIAGLEVPGGSISPTNWTRDGRWIWGYVVDSTGETKGFGALDTRSGKAKHLNQDSRNYDMGWMPDNRHVVYFTVRGALVMQDVETLERHEVVSTLPWRPDQFGSLTASRDGRTLYYGAYQIEANIWLVKRTGPASRSP
jgi:serine/threonine-protein kinase